MESRRKLQVTEQMFFRWRKKFVELGKPDIRELCKLLEENKKLKQRGADLRLYKMILLSCVSPYEIGGSAEPTFDCRSGLRNPRVGHFAGRSGDFLTSNDP